MKLHDVEYSVERGIATVTLSRTRYRNAQSWRLLDELDKAFETGVSDKGVKVIILQGAGGDFSTGHDLGSPEQVADRERRRIDPGSLEYYNSFRWYNLESALKWRNLPKPTIAMVEGWCINGGWELASAMDIVFAADNARFVCSQMEYFTQPWDIGFRKAKEVLFESRVISASEAESLGFVNRVIPAPELRKQTFAYAMRCADNPLGLLRMAKLAVNRAQDIMGYTTAVEAGFSDHVMRSTLEVNPRLEGQRRMWNVELALRHLRGSDSVSVPATPERSRR